MLISRVALTLASILVLSLLPVEEIPLSNWNGKLQHLLAFMLISGLIDASWPATRFHWGKMACALGYGVLIEFLQGFTDHRQMSMADLIADAFGIGLYVLLIPLWQKIPVIKLRWHLPAIHHTGKASPPAQNRFRNFPSDND